MLSNQILTTVAHSFVHSQRNLLGEPLTEIDALRIRFLTFCHLPATTLAPLLEGGSDLDSNPIGSFSSHLLQFDDSHIATYSFTHAESKMTTIVHPILSKAICTHNAEFLVENAKLPDFHQKTHILLPLLIKNSYWVLIAANLSNSTICIMDPMQHPSNQHTDSLIKNAAKTVQQLALHDRYLKICQPPQCQSSDIASNSGPLVCGYFEAIAKGTSPNNIHIDRIRRTCNALKKKFTRTYQFKGPQTTSTIPTKATIETRRSLANNLLSQIQTMPISEAFDTIV